MICRCAVDGVGQLAQRLHAVLAHGPWPTSRSSSLSPLPTSLRPRGDRVSTSRCAYQTSRIGCSANSASRCGSRPRPPGRSGGGLRSRKPLSRPATARLATRRLTSHSNGPGSVSSKSLTSKTSRRSGDAKHRSSTGARRRTAARAGRVRGSGCQIGGHRQRGAPEEREGRDEHPPVPDRHQLGHPRLRLRSSSSPTGSRPLAGLYSACDSSGVTALASFPSAARSVWLRCPPAPARAEPRPEGRIPDV